MSSTSTDSRVQNGGNYVGGGTFTMDLPADNANIVTRIYFKGRQTGTITVSAWTTESDDAREEPLGSIDLSVNGSLITRDFPLRKLKFFDTGTGEFWVLVRQESV